MSKIKNIEGIVKDILENDVATRNDNFLLVYEVYKKINFKVTVISFVHVMKEHKELGLPSFETIVRCRRKVQAEHEELKPTKKMQYKRKEEEAKHINYAHNLN